MFAWLRLAAMVHVLDLALSCVLLSLGWMQEANPLALASSRRPEWRD